MRASGVRKYIDFRTKYNIEIYDNYSLERIVTTEILLILLRAMYIAIYNK